MLDQDFVILAPEIKSKYSIASLLCYKIRTLKVSSYLIKNVGGALVDGMCRCNNT